MDDRDEFEQDAPIVQEEQPQDAPQYDPELAEKARQYGWKPKEEWQGDPPPHGFMAPDEYLSRPAVQLRITRDELEETRKQVQDWSSRYDTDLAQIKSAHQHAQKLQREHHERTVQQLKADMRLAVEDGDTERYDRAQKALDGMQAPDPVQQQPQQRDEAAAKWLEDHPHIANDPFYGAEMQRVAQAIADRGGDTVAQISGVERYFRAHYADVELKNAPKERPKPRTVVDGGGLGGDGGNGGWDSLPKEVRAIGDELIEDGVFDRYGKTKAERRAAYAKSYKEQLA